MKEKEKIFRDIINQHYDKIYRLSWSYIRNCSDHEDLIQNILIKIWQYLETFNHKSSIGTWIYKVTVNASIDFIRKEKRKPYNLNETADNEKIIDAENDIERNFIKKEQLKILHRCIKRLSIIEQTLITLYLEDLKYSEIADILGISEKNVGVKLLRIKKKINSFLQ